MIVIMIIFYLLLLSILFLTACFTVHFHEIDSLMLLFCSIMTVYTGFIWLLEHEVAKLRQTSCIYFVC